MTNNHPKTYYIHTYIYIYIHVYIYIYNNEKTTILNFQQHLEAFKTDLLRNPLGIPSSIVDLKVKNSPLQEIKRTN